MHNGGDRFIIVQYSKFVFLGFAKKSVCGIIHSVQRIIPIHLNNAILIQVNLNFLASLHHPNYAQKLSFNMHSPKSIYTLYAKSKIYCISQQCVFILYAFDGTIATYNK